MTEAWKRSHVRYLFTPLACAEAGNETGPGKAEGRWASKHITTHRMRAINGDHRLPVLVIGKASLRT